jgi:hypothetical protein
MELLTETLKAALLANGRINGERMADDGNTIDFKHVVRLFTPDAGCTWLLTELDPLDPNIAFGLCDLGMGSPELGSVRISEIESLRGALGLPVESDHHFEPEYTLMVYARAAATDRPDTMHTSMILGLPKMSWSGSHANMHTLVWSSRKWF